MEGNKLEISGRVTEDPPPATYKQIPEADVEEKAVKERPKSLTKSLKSNNEMDGADEQMLPKEEKSTVVPTEAGDAKFTNNEKQNGEAKLDIGEIKSAFIGMSKEELMKFATDPFWIRLRWILFIAFWLLWLAMLAGAVVIIITAPKCAPPAPRTWWEQGPLTEVKRDVSDDKLQELKKHKIEGIIIVSGPEEIEDSYKSVNESTEVLTLLQRAKNQGFKVIVELQPVSTWMWFNKSENNDEQYKDYYIWESPKENNEENNPVEPNNWLTWNGDKAWKFSEARKQFYFRMSAQPQLNFRNQHVIDEFSNVIRQWLDQGADGIRLRGAPYLLTDPKLRNAPISSVPGSIHDEHTFYNHDSRLANVEGIAEILSQWKSILRNHKEENPGPLMVTEDLQSLERYETNRTLSIDLPSVSKLFMSNDRLTSASKIFIGLNVTFPITHWPLWQYASNITTLSENVLNMLTMLLPGCPLIPFNTAANNTADLVKIRENPSIMFGTMHMELLANKTIFAYLRVAAGNPGYLVAVNPTEKLVNVDFTAMQNVSNEVTVQAISPSFDSKYELNYKISANNVELPPKSAIVLTYVPKTKDD